MAEQQALQLLQEQLEFFLRQEVTATGAAEKFALKKQIEECKAKIAELLNPPQAKLSEQSGPIVSIAHLPPAVAHFMGRERELERLDAAWEDPNTPVISLVAFGGVGKSALVAAWLQSLRADNWRGAHYVLGHSFYSQGSRDDAQVSAEGFIDEALRFFGDPNPEEGSAWDKGERLARWVRRSKTLLILDGEPLQWGAASVEVGRIKDQGLTALVRELAADNAGLCVITTRQPVADIPAAAKIDLEALSDKAGAALLGALGVKGLPQELEEASRQVKGHGLALRLLGTYLRKACQGDVSRIGEVELALVDQRLGGHAFKLVEKNERWLREGPELSILRLLGLFDRPAEPDSVAAVCAAPIIPGLTDTLVGLSSEDWNWHISNLVDYGLLSSDAKTTNGNEHNLIQNPKSKILWTLILSSANTSPPNSPPNTQMQPAKPIVASTSILNRLPQNYLIRCKR
ncbi:MAG: AAA family ATPase [Leptolyngbyaceae cyanobacterium MO_188.B28]|nr:AAA family ATPase [Leptolyngbyaceae cyanobacterium MO_188.B28]